MKKRIISAIILISMILSMLGVMTSCDLLGEVNPTALSAPTVTSVDNGLVRWTSISNADAYIVSVNQIETRTTELSFPLSAVLNEAGTAHIKVKAKGNGILYSDSEWSALYTYEYTPESAGTSSALAAPTVLGCNNNVVSWTSVANASGYIVKVNGVEEFVYNSRYDVLLEESGSFTFQVMAVAAYGDPNYTNSAWSEVEAFEYVRDMTIEDIASYKDYQKYSLGMGINTITGTYLAFDGDTFKPYEFLNIKELSGDYELRTMNAQSTSLTTIEEDSIEEFMQKFAKDYTHTNSALANGGIDGYGFSGTVSRKFNLATGFELKWKTHQYYSLSYQSIADRRVYIPNFDPDYIKGQSGLISEYALSKLDEMASLSGEELDNQIISFFDKMGTHIVTDAVYGGKLEVYYYILTNDLTWDTNATLALSNSLVAAVSYQGVTTGAGTAAELDKSLCINGNNQNTIAKFYALGIGGNGLTANTYSEFAAAYQKWIEDYNSGTNHSTMIDISSGGLCPIWDLLPDEYSSIADRMNEIYIQEIESASNSFISEFEINEVIENNNTTDFLKGNGTEEHPYVISTFAHLSNVAAKDGEGVYFELQNDIDLTGLTFYSLPSFRGTLDGNNHSIINWIMLPMTESLNGGKSFAFIRENFGTIKNLKMKYTNGEKVIDINYDKSGVTPSMWKYYAGTLTAINRDTGKIINCGVENAKINIDLKFYDLARDSTLEIFAGGLIGENYGTVEYAYSTGCNIRAWNGVEGQEHNTVIFCAAGGLIGKNQGKVSYAYTYGTSVDSTTKGGNWLVFQSAQYLKNYVGALVGENNSTIEYSIAYNHGDISAKDGLYSGAMTIDTKAGVICGKNYGAIKYFCTLTNDSMGGSIIADSSSGTYEGHVAKSTVNEFLYVSGMISKFTVDESGNISFGSLKK